MASDEEKNLLAQATIALTVTASGYPPRLGTGFVIGPKMVATCAHVLADHADGLPKSVDALHVALDIRTQLLPDPELYFYDDNGLDLALLRMDGINPLAKVTAVLTSPRLLVGDAVWGYGHPSGAFRAGQPATFHYEGDSGRSTAEGSPRLRRLRGTPVTGGFSGSAVVNSRTGAVCGMLTSSNLNGGAHLLGIDEILAHCPTADILRSDVAYHEAWMQALSDDQLRAGGWAYPGPRLRSYASLAVRAAQTHPYPGVLPGTPPPLSTVYVHQYVAADDVGEAQESRSVALPAETILDSSSDVVLFGTAGAGKSSLLRTAVIDMASRIERASAVPVRVLAADLAPMRPLAEAIAASATADLAAVGLPQALPADMFAQRPMPDVPWLVLSTGSTRL